MGTARFAPSVSSSSSLRRLVAGALAVALLGAGVPARAALSAPQGEIERLFLEGQNRFEEKDYAGAADSWGRLLELLPESGEYKDTRETLIINVLDARIQAFHGLRKADGSKDIDHLRQGKAQLTTYYAEFKRVHGDRVAVSTAVQQKGDELEQLLGAAEAAQGRESSSDETSDDDGDGGTQPVEPTTSGESAPAPMIIAPQRDGTGLIAGGAVVGVLGLAAFSMIPIGAVRGNQAEEDLGQAKAMNDSVAEERANFDGEQANAILISGAVLAPLLLAGSATMIVFGIKFRKRAQEEQLRSVRSAVLVPSIGKSYAGFALSGRF